MPKKKLKKKVVKGKVIAPKPKRSRSGVPELSKRPTKAEYAKLRMHPKWQKKRLRVFQRDKWQCRQCKDKETTLHVHHLKYTKYYPWNEPMNNLVTLCARCHGRGHKKI